MLVAVALFLVPSIAMAAMFGFLAERVRDVRGSLGWAVEINSLGAALAPLAAAEVFIPAWGAWRSLVIVAAGYLLLIPLRRALLAWM